MAGHPQATYRRVQSMRPQPVIVAKLKQEQLRLSVTNPHLAPSGCKPSAEPQIHQAPRSANAEGDIKAASTIQMQHLQEGSDVNGATIARPQRTGFSPLDDNARWEDTTPPTGKAAPTGIAVVKAFA